MGWLATPILVIGGGPNVSMRMVESSQGPWGGSTTHKNKIFNPKKKKEVLLRIFFFLKKKNINQSSRYFPLRNHFHDLERQLGLC